MYSWRPLYKEITTWLLQYRHRQKELCSFLEKTGFEGNLEDTRIDGKKKPLEVMDPFTFIAFFQKIKNQENRIAYLKALKKLVSLKSPLPTDFQGLPSAQPMALWYFSFEKDRPSNQLDTLWDFAIQAMKGELNSDTFQTVLSYKGIQLAKLTQGLFWLNPDAFYPVDSHRHFLEESGIDVDVETLQDYLNLLNRIKSKFNEPFYEISNRAWLSSHQYQENEKKTLSQAEKSSSVKERVMSQSLNQILYGPPGTGKTYKTIEKAIAIANPGFIIEGRERSELKVEFERLKEAGQIEFITFHQSISYEDFIEGIKPVKPTEEDKYLKYEVKPGILNLLVNRALYEPTVSKQVFAISEDEFEKASFFKMSLGNTLNPDEAKTYRYCIDNGCIGLGWGDVHDFTGKSEEEIQKMSPGTLTKSEARFVNTFIHYMKKGDYVIVSNGNFLFRAIGKVVGDYEYRNEEGIEIKQFRKVEWLIRDIDISYDNIYSKQFIQPTIYYLNKQEIKKDFLVRSNSESTSSEKRRNYVLIIDEINRGNIAQIFGELITLIETDKRKGKPEALEVRLPYSGDLFTIPDNLYIIGTMNTADRSVEALDTALRRRFVFEEMMPQSEVIANNFEKAFLSTCVKYADYAWDDEEWLTVESKFRDAILQSDEDDALEQFKELINAENKATDYAFYQRSWATCDVRVVTAEKLKVLNSRIEILLNRDHQIGHSYFIGKYSRQDIYHTFFKNVIPLLKEYFFGDYGKIGLVLGKAFVFANVQENSTLLSDFEYPGVEDFDHKTIYHINEFLTPDGMPDYDAFYTAFCTI